MQVEQVEPAATLLTHNHQGVSNPPETLFFASPPLEIGAIHSAHSNNMVGAKQRKAWAKEGFAALVLGAMFGNATGFLLHLPLTILTLLGLGIGGIVGCFVRPHLRCTFIGEKGLARVVKTVKGDKAERFLFSLQSSVGVSVTERYSNGIYNGTSFTYTFYDGETKTTFEVRGSYHDRYGMKISPDSEWHFGQQGEISLLNYLLPLAQKRLAQGEDQSFMLKDRRQITLQADALTIVAGNKKYTIPYLDLQTVSIKSGTIEILEQGGRNGFLGIGQKGIFSFSYSEMPNAKLFFVLLQQKIQEAEQRNAG
jgi:hypothetical protein